MNGGDTFINHDKQPAHLWVVLSDPIQDPDRVICVSFSTYRGKPYEEQTCILEPGCHPFITRRTRVCFGLSEQRSAASINLLMRIHKIVAKDPIGPELLKLLRERAAGSQMIPLHKQVLRDQGFIP